MLFSFILIFIMSILQIGLIILIVISAMYLISFWAISKKGDYEKLSAYENGFNVRCLISNNKRTVVLLDCYYI